MANYSQTTGLLASMLVPFENLQSAEYRKSMVDIIGLINTEFAAAASGQDGYTVTSGLAASIQGILQSVNDILIRNTIKNFMDTVIAEFTSAGDGTMFNYTVTTGLKNLMIQDVSNHPDVELRIAYHSLIDLLFVEFTAMAAAS